MSSLTRKILVGTIIFILAISLIEIFFKVPEMSKKVEQDIETTNRNKEPKKPVVETSGEKTTNYEELNFKISNFINKITHKKYQEAYDLLNPDYKALYYPSLQKFIETNSTFYEKDKIVSLKYFNKVKKNQYVCRIRIVDLDDLTDPSQFDSLTSVEEFVTVNILDDDKYTIAPDGFLSTKTVNYNTKVGEIWLKVSRIDRHNNKAYITLEVSNGENVPITIIDPVSTEPKENIKLSSDGGVDGPRNIRTYFEHDYDLYELCQTVPPGLAKKFSLPFNVIHDQDLTKLTFNNIMVGTVTRTAKLELK